MSDILAKLKAAHDARDADLIAVPVPEYEDTWYFRPISLADQQAVQKGVNLKSPTAEMELMVNLIILLARDEKGERLFNVPTNQKASLRVELMRMDPAVLMRITIQAGNDLPSAAAAELAALDQDAVRSALVSAVGSEAEHLGGALGRVDFDVIQQALSEILRVDARARPAKNV